MTTLTLGGPPRTSPGFLGSTEVSMQTLLALPYEERGALLRRNIAWREMEARLLSIGGTRLAYQPDRDAAELVKHGQVYTPARRQMVRGEPNECHGNAAALWLRRRPRVSLVTGWALSEDGCWRQHSWGWRREGQVWVETTIDRLAGFGVELDGLKGLAFAFENLGSVRAAPLIMAALDADPALSAVLRV